LISLFYLDLPVLGESACSTRDSLFWEIVGVLGGAGREGKVYQPWSGRDVVSLAG